MAERSPKPKPLPAAQFCLENDIAHSNPIAGIDEVGRGPLVGTVLASAVILPQDHGIEGLKDSKKLSEKKREQIAQEIKEKALVWALGSASPQEIDQLNILKASLLAMSRAVAALDKQPAFALVDGNKLPPDLPCASAAVVKGDGRVQEIAAASILAKVARDDEMKVLDQQYPQYGFAQHKGYPTRLHMEKLVEHGALPEHRRSFGPVRRLLEERGDL